MYKQTKGWFVSAVIRFIRMRQQSAACGARRAAGVRATATTTTLSSPRRRCCCCTQSILTSDKVAGGCCRLRLARPCLADDPRLRSSVLQLAPFPCCCCSVSPVSSRAVFDTQAGLSGSTTQSRGGGRVARVGRSSQFSPWGSNWCAWRSGSVRPRRWPAGTGGRRAAAARRARRPARRMRARSQ